MIVDINETTAIEIEKNLKILSQSVSEIENLVKVSYYNFGKTESKERQKNPYIVKSVIKNLACGHNETNAILLTASEYETTFERVYAIYSEQKKYRSAIVLFAKRYMCAKLICIFFSKRKGTQAPFPTHLTYFKITSKISSINLMIIINFTIISFLSAFPHWERS